MTNPGDAVGTNGAYGGRTSVNAFNDVLATFKGRGIVKGWGCAPKSGMTVSLGGQDMIRDVAIVENDIGQCTTLDNISTQPIDITLSDAPTLGSRIDVIVGYVNNPPDSNGKIIDNPDACGLIAVESTVATDPTVPDEAMIREAITADGGSGTNAYYVVLATINVGTDMTTVSGGEIKQGSRAEYSNNPNLKVYDVTPTSDGVINIVDSSLPTSPTTGLTFVIRPETAVTNPQISLNGGTAIIGVVQAVAGGRSSSQRNSVFTLDQYSLYIVFYANNYWRFTNVFDFIQTNDIADSAVTTSKIANGSINSNKITANSIYRAMIANGEVTGAKLADGAVTAAKADVAGIMNSAGTNRQLFGLGGNVINISNGNADNLTKTGFYAGAAVTNAPTSGADEWYLITHENHSDNYAVQTARSWYDGNVWQRGKAGGTWRTWVKVQTSQNINVGNGAQIGQLDNGTPVYHKVFDTRTPNTSGAYATVGNIGANHTVFSLTATYAADGAQTAIPSSGAGGNTLIRYMTSSGDIQMQFTGTYGLNCPAHINVIYY